MLLQDVRLAAEVVLLELIERGISGSHDSKRIWIGRVGS